MTSKIRLRPLAGLALGALGATTLAAGVAFAADPADVQLLDRQTSLQSSIDVIRTENRFERLRDRARELGLPAPASAAVASPAGLETRLAQLRARVEREQRQQRRERRRKQADSGGRVGSPESVGVSPATLESIAACESGGDPAAVDPSGTYRGKYQFDLGTWASVGGSGDPAAAPEREQDYRAALLLSRAGSSPWPVCGS
jgi:hypothetical protein